MQDSAEHTIEKRNVAKPIRECNFENGPVGFLEFLAGRPQAYLGEEFAETPARVLPELPGKSWLAHAHQIQDLGQADLFAEMRQQIAYCFAHRLAMVGGGWQRKRPCRKEGLVPLRCADQTR